MKMKKIVLEDLRKNTFHDAAFKVKKIVNSIEYKIGDILKEGAVEFLCNTENWTVEIVKKSA